MSELEKGVRDELEEFKEQIRNIKDPVKRAKGKRILKDLYGIFFGDD